MKFKLLILWKSLIITNLREGTTMRKSRTYIAIPPGTTIKEQLLDRGMRQKEFAARMGMSEKHISKLINGEVQLTIEVARKLEMVLDVPTQFWCNLEAVYREDLAKVKEENTMDEDLAIAQKMPYEKMAEKGWIVDVVKNTEKVLHLRKYFELAELKFLQSTLIPRIACRKLSKMEKDDCVLIAWAQKAKLEARKIETDAIDIEKLKENIPLVREILSLKKNELYTELQKFFARYGIAVVFLPKMEVGFLHGATFIDGNKIVMGLTECDRDKDEFIFSLFHEIAHIVFGHIEKTDGISKEDEKCADEYAECMMKTIYALNDENGARA